MEMFTDCGNLNYYSCMQRYFFNLWEQPTNPDMLKWF
jgi:hypothetical protein